MHSFNTNRISEHAHKMRDERQHCTALENNRIDSRMNRAQEITKQYKTRHVFCEYYETVREYGTYYTAKVIHDPQTTLFIAPQSQQITERGDINSFYRIPVTDNLKRISTRSCTMETNTIIHISSLNDD